MGCGLISSGGWFGGLGFGPAGLFPLFFCSFLFLLFVFYFELSKMNLVPFLIKSSHDIFIKYCFEYVEVIMTLGLQFPSFQK